MGHEYPWHKGGGVFWGIWSNISGSLAWLCITDSLSWRLIISDPRSLVSTYVVCERLSVMHEPAGVVEILVLILQNTPYSEIQFQNTPPPPNWNLGRSWHFKNFQFQNTPLPENWNTRYSICAFSAFHELIRSHSYVIWTYKHMHVVLFTL